MLYSTRTHDFDFEYCGLLYSPFGYGIGIENSLSLYSLYCIVSILTASLGIFGLFKTINSKRIIALRDKPDTSLTYIMSFFWSTVLVCAAINISCFTATLYVWAESYDNETKGVFVPMILLSIIELLPVGIIVGKFYFEIENLQFNNLQARWIQIRSKLERKRLWCAVVLYTLATCHILWFIHRVTLNLIVAMYYIAVAPVQTLAAITLIYSVIFCTIVYVAYNFISWKDVGCKSLPNPSTGTETPLAPRKKRLIIFLVFCGTACNLFVVLLVYCGIIGILICLTRIFNEMVDNGLTSSGLGSVLLSLVAPTIVFIVTLSLKGYLKKWFKAAKPGGSDVENPEVVEVAENGTHEVNTGATPLSVNGEV